MRMLSKFAALALTSAIPVSNATAAPPVLPENSRIVFDEESWGHLIRHWELLPDGSGEYWSMKLAWGPIQPGPIKKFRMHVDRETMQQIVALLVPLRAHVSEGVDCKFETPDMGYGTVEWQFSDVTTRWKYNVGCRSERADQAYRDLFAANALIDNKAQRDEQPFAVVER